MSSCVFISYSSAKLRIAKYSSPTTRPTAKAKVAGSNPVFRSSFSEGPAFSESRAVSLRYNFALMYLARIILAAV